MKVGTHVKIEFDDEDKAIAGEVMAKIKKGIAPVIEGGRPFAEAGTMIALGATRLFRAGKAAGLFGK